MLSPKLNVYSISVHVLFPHRILIIGSRQHSNRTRPRMAIHWYLNPISKACLQQFKTQRLKEASFHSRIAPMAL